MILDGNSRVGQPKVYRTQKEMDQEKEIIQLKARCEKLERENGYLIEANKSLHANNEYIEQRLADAEQVIALLPVDDCAMDLSLCLHDELIEIIMSRDRVAREHMSKHKEGGA